MPTIKARKQANGVTRYTAIVRMRRGAAIIHRESKTFAHRTAALSWARHRQVALEDPATLVREQQGAPTLAGLIRGYIEAFETISKWQRSKQTHLEFLERHALGKTNALSLTAAMLIDHVRSRRAEGTGAATVANDLIWIGVVLRAARSVKELPVRPEVVQQARNACRELRLIGRARRRARRPTPEELARLREYFARRDQRSTIRMLPAWNSRSAPLDARPRSAGSNGATTMPRHALASCATPCTPPTRTAITGVSNTRRRRGRSSRHSRRRASTSSRMTRRA